MPSYVLWNETRLFRSQLALCRDVRVAIKDIRKRQNGVLIISGKQKKRSTGKFGGIDLLALLISDRQTCLSTGGGGGKLPF